MRRDLWEDRQERLYEVQKPDCLFFSIAEKEDEEDLQPLVVVEKGKETVTEIEALAERVE